MIFEDSRKWLKADSIKIGESITILDKGDWVISGKFTNENGEPKKDFVCKVMYQGIPHDLTINKTRRIALITAYGKDSEGWVGKVCNMEPVNQMIGNKIGKTIVLYPVGGVVKIVDKGYEA